MTFEQMTTERRPVELTPMECLLILNALELAPQNAIDHESLTARLADAMLARVPKPPRPALKLVA